MKKISLALLFLVATTIAYCSLPLTSVAILTLTLSDQTGRKITSDATAIYVDSDGKPLVSITFTTPSSWDNNLHWWSHSYHAASTLRPVDAQRAAMVEVTVKNCETTKIPVILERRYEPMSLMPHGGGEAYFLYSFEKDVILRCKQPPTASAVPQNLRNKAPSKWLARFQLAHGCVSRRHGVCKETPIRAA